jgi:tRNA(adenine34) deaminase
MGVSTAERDARWMARALELARQAESAGEVPVGAVVVSGDEAIGEGWNRTIGDSDPSAHAEVVALRDAGRRVSNYRLPGAELYVTLEPCVMCSGALVHARLARVVYGTRDPRTGAAGSVFDVLASELHNHRIDVVEGVRAEESARLLRAFFRSRR